MMMMMTMMTQPTTCYATNKTTGQPTNQPTIQSNPIQSNSQSVNLSLSVNQSIKQTNQPSRWSRWGTFFFSGARSTTRFTNLSQVSWIAWCWWRDLRMTLFDVFIKYSSSMQQTLGVFYRNVKLFRKPSKILTDRSYHSLKDSWVPSCLGRIWQGFVHGLWVHMGLDVCYHFIPRMIV